MIEDSLNSRDRVTFKYLTLKPVNPRVLPRYLAPVIDPVVVVLNRNFRFTTRKGCE